MALENVKIKVKATTDDDKICCFIAKPIASIFDILVSVRYQFGAVAVQEISYKGKFPL